MDQNSMKNLSELDYGIRGVKKVVIIFSGKGGVGKSTICTTLAKLLAFEMEKKVGVLDLDLCGPSIEHMLGKCEARYQDLDIVKNEKNLWVPKQISERIYALALSYLIEDKDNPVIWRGPKKNSIISQFINEVDWNGCDYLIIDTPPGTSDEHITLAENVYNHSNVTSIIVTTPQKVSVNDVRRIMTFCRKTNIPISDISSALETPDTQAFQKQLSYRDEQIDTSKKEISIEQHVLKLSIEFDVPIIAQLPFYFNLMANLDDGDSSIMQKNNSLDENQSFFTEFKNILHYI